VIDEKPEDPLPRSTRIGVALAAAIILAAVAASVAFAQGELLGGKLRTGDTVTVGADEAVDGDLCVIAGTVTVDGSVDGDLTAFGGQVQLNGTVSGDVLTAGGTVSISGDVAGDLRTAGGQVTLNGSVGEDVIAAGGQTTLQGGATVEGDLVVSGGQVTMGGAVAGNIEANAGTYSRSGTVGGTEHVVQGDRGAADDHDDADEFADDALDAFRHFVVLLLLGAALLWLLPRVLGSAEIALRERPAASLGFGVLAFLGYVVLVVIAIILIILLAILFGVLQLGALVAIEIVGGLLAIFVASFGFVVAVAFVADLVVGLGIARLMARNPEAGWWERFGMLAAGVAVVVIVTSLPIIGGIAKLLVILFGLGALFLAARAAWGGRGSTPTAAPPAPPAPVA
jgi:cytoskeletal protein CcmA (bactofilin family)